MSTTVEILSKRLQNKANRVKNLKRGGGVGRPVGSKNKPTLLKEAILQKAEEKVVQEFINIVDTTIKLAHAGDTTCLKILWDRIIPAKRAIDINHTNDDKLNVVINVSGMETKGIKDVAIVDAEIVDDKS